MPTEASSSLDIPTGRYYCIECLEPTIEEMLRLQEKGFSDSFADRILARNPDARDEVEKLFSRMTEEEEQDELEKIFYGESELTREWN